MTNFIDAKLPTAEALRKPGVLTERKASSQSSGTAPVRRSFRSHRSLCRPEVIPWDGYCPNTLEELEQSGY